MTEAQLQPTGPDPAAGRQEDDGVRVERELRRRHGRRIADLLERQPVWAKDFGDLSYEWRRLFSELFGTFLLVLAGAGAPVVDYASHGQVGRVAAVLAPALTVLAAVLFMGAVSGAHLNPVVTIAFALRREFGWRRVPGYLAAQLAGAVLAAGLLRVIFGQVDHLGATLPGPGFSATQACAIEAVLTLGLVSTILGTASSAQNVGSLSALGVAGYIALAGLWASPVSGASMNPARTLGPALVAGDARGLWAYLVGPLIGALCAVGAAIILRGPGGDPGAIRAAQGTLARRPRRSPGERPARQHSSPASEGHDDA
ncbi:MAG TPA: aquaporin [Jatrophihabitans sp.]|nr:aquaporin [Jatrophihabitans sp.]